jgi:hypothetical protein
MGKVGLFVVGGRAEINKISGLLDGFYPKWPAKVLMIALKEPPMIGIMEPLESGHIWVSDRVKK